MCQDCQRNRTGPHTAPMRVRPTTEPMPRTPVPRRASARQQPPRISPTRRYLITDTAPLPRPREKTSRRHLLKASIIAIGMGAATALGALEVRSLITHEPVITIFPGTSLFPDAHTLPNDTPAIHNTSAWKARPPSGPLPILPQKSTKILIHQTQTSNTGDTSLGHAYSLARTIQNFHMDANGWPDTGQHFTVTRGGYILEGRHNSVQALMSGSYHVVGAHCPELNSEAIGIENEGTYFSDLPPEAHWNALISFCIFICKQYGFGAEGIFGHWDFSNTDCPGTRFYSQLPRLRKEVAQRLGQSMPPLTWPDHRPGTSGETVRTLRTLLNLHYRNLGVSDDFDDETEDALKRFQTEHRLPANAYTTAKTWEALVMPLNKKSTGDVVRAVQSHLRMKGFGADVNGRFDGKTISALQKLQQLHGLPATEEVDLKTWCALLGGVIG